MKNLLKRLLGIKPKPIKSKDPEWKSQIPQSYIDCNDLNFTCEFRDVLSTIKYVGTILQNLKNSINKEHFDALFEMYPSIKKDFEFFTTYDKWKGDPEKLDELFKRFAPYYYTNIEKFNQTTITPPSTHTNDN